MDIFKIKKNDTLPALSVTLNNSSDEAIDLSNGSVWFNMAHLTNYSSYVSGICVITGSTTGNVEYQWTGSIDTGSVGTYWAEFEFQNSGSKMTFPSDHNLQVQVYENYN
jgi:hypothetical protein